MEGQTQAVHSIRGEFRMGQEVFDKIENTELSSSDPQYQQMVKEAIGHFLRVATLVQQLSVFSKNEVMEDINTGDLRYLLTDFYLGELYSKVASEDRLRTVTTAQGYYNSFLHRCLTHQLLTKEEQEEQALVEEPPKDMSEQRRIKIERHQRQKELKARVAHLTSQLQAHKASAEDYDEEELDRELILALLHLFVQCSFDSLGLIDKELQILQMMHQMREQGQPLPQPPAPRDPSAQGGFKPIVIKNTREVLQHQVFQPGWRQPTMSLDEYLELERQRGGIIEGGGPEQEARMAREKELKLQKDSEADADEETMKARQFDEFKDYNPRGQGNRYNRS